MEIVKNQKRGRRRIKNIFSLVLLIGVFLLWGFYALLESDLLNLKHIDVYGNNVVEYEDIVDASKLIMHRNIYKYELGKIKENLLSHPYIKDVVISRKLPNRIILDVQERDEYAIISYMGSYIFVDQELIALKVTDGYLSQELPLITGIEFQSLKLGEVVVAVNQSNLANIIKVLAAAKVTDMLDVISEVNASEESNFRIITIDGIEVLLGDADNPVYSMLVLKDVLVKLYTNNRRNVIIDLRYEGTTTIRDRN